MRNSIYKNEKIRSYCMYSTLWSDMEKRSKIKEIKTINTNRFLI